MSSQQRHQLEGFLRRGRQIAMHLNFPTTLLVAAWIAHTNWGKDRYLTPYELIRQLPTWNRLAPRIVWINACTTIYGEKWKEIVLKYQNDHNLIRAIVNIPIYAN